MRVRYVNFRKTVIEWPDMRNRSSAVHHDDEGSLAADEVDQELKEGV